ncbi:MAG TPA: hypothetical protein VEA59_02960 [Patescibacteria group bacterium]|nr:hypothetical protein [Patescibacteria group bacterium]
MSTMTAGEGYTFALTVLAGYNIEYTVTMPGMTVSVKQPVDELLREAFGKLWVVSNPKPPSFVIYNKATQRQFAVVITDIQPLEEGKPLKGQLVSFF